MHNSKASLYLMELMISILFFAISSSVCVQLFVKAHLLDQETDIRTRAVLVVSNTAEYFLSSGGNKEKTLSYYTDYSEKDNQVTLYYDNSFKPCTSEIAAYEENILFHSDKSYSYADIEFCEAGNNNSFYGLNIKKYIPGGNSNEKE